MSYLRESVKSKVPGIAFRVFEPNAEGAVMLEGLGLHSGALFRVTLQQALREGQGIVFRSRIEGVEYSAPAHWMRVSGTSRATALILRGNSRRRFELHTVEHFLAAALVSGLSDLDVIIEAVEGIKGETLELPNLDGSAAAWYGALSALRTRASRASMALGRPCWKIIRSLEVVDGTRRVLFSPTDGEGSVARTLYHCAVKYGTISQAAFFEIDWRDLVPAQDLFASRIAPARTFGFRAELESLEKRGLAKGANLANALLLDGDRVVNDEGYRVPNELAAHKLMDAVGDLALLGAPFLGRIDLQEAGHSMHLRALEEAHRTGAFAKGRLLASGAFLPET